MSKIPLLAVVGPTASGKTKLAVELALTYNGEVVSADSMQIYRRMDIGTAKPDEAEKKGVPHHMIDVIDPSETFSVADYVARARACILDICSRGRLPILAGGTGLYVDSLIDNITFTPAGSDEGLRLELREIAGREGGQVLLDRLAVYDPQSAAKLHPNNLGRIIRAIEVYETTGITMTEMQRQSRSTPSDYDLCILGLSYPDRSVLYDRINVRVDQMFDRGLVEEVRALLDAGEAGSTAMQAIGYKETAAYLRGECSLEEAKETIKQGSRRYAKRQMTWFNRNPRIRWLTFGGPEDFEKNYQTSCELIDKWQGL